MGPLSEFEAEGLLLPPVLSPALLFFSSIHRVEWLCLGWFVSPFLERLCTASMSGDACDAL